MFVLIACKIDFLVHNSCNLQIPNLIFLFYRSEDEGEDVVDSDFSIDENDEVISENEEEEKTKRSNLVYKVHWV